MERLRSSGGLSFLAGRWPLGPELPTLLLIHGAGGSALHWEVQLDQLLDQANTLAIDLPGHGQSPGPGREEVAAYTRALVELVDELNPPRPVPVGFSMGGAIAQQALLDYPDRFAAAVLIATGAKLKVLPLVFETIQNDFPAYIEMKARMAATSSGTLANEPRRMACRLMMPKKTSTRLSHEPEVGLKWSVTRGCLASHRSMSACLWEWSLSRTTCSSCPG